MAKLKKKGFTLIELIAVLVIMAILALIATPIIMNIIRKARVSADKRSIDAYARSIEYAIASYLLDTGKFPTSVGDLTIEYSGNQVVCETTQLNPDSSVYLTGCTVAGRNVEYTYGTDKSPSYTAYTVGDEVTYNGVDYYVIKDSGVKESTVTLLKAEPLTVDEVNFYGGVGTANNHVNMYVTDNPSASYYQTAYDKNGYGGMAYYSSSTCGRKPYSNYTELGCTTDYEQSEVKYVIDAWKENQAPVVIEARLITYDELILETVQRCTGSCYDVIIMGYDWLNGGYFTSTQYNDSSSHVWEVSDTGEISNGSVTSMGLVRPVIVLPKSALQ